MFWDCEIAIEMPERDKNPVYYCSKCSYSGSVASLIKHVSKTCVGGRIRRVKHTLDNDRVPRARSPEEC